MASAERKPIRGSRGCAPNGVQGQSPGGGFRGASSPEADDILENKTVYTNSFIKFGHRIVD